MDPRHRKRLKIVQNLFAVSFVSDTTISLPQEQEKAVTDRILKHIEEIDTCIRKYAPKYPLDKIARIDKCILRLALYELLIEKEQPTKVIINEAVELAKELGNDRSYAFINAVLGAIVSEINSQSNTDGNTTETT